MTFKRLAKNTALGIIALFVASGLVCASWAVNIPIVNSGFEDPVIDPGEFATSSAPPGWNDIGSIDFGFRAIGVLNPSSTLLYTNPVPEGVNVGVVFLGLTFNNVPSGLEQTLSTSLQARTRYTLTVEVGNINNALPPPDNQFEFAGFPGYRIELLAGTNIVAVDDNTLLPDEGAFLISTVEVAIASSHTNIGEVLSIRLINLDQAPGIEVNFDDIRLDATPLPDPEISISLNTNGMVQIDFTEILSDSVDLDLWSPLSPQPLSPLIISPTNQHRYYRASD